MTDWFQWAIIAFIISSILYHVWKGGAANPEGTGSLGRKVSGLSTQVSALSGRTAIQISGLSERLGQVEEDVKAVKQEAVTTGDINKLEQLVDAKLNTVRAEIEGHRALSKATNDSVRRIERIIIERGLAGK